MSIVSGVRKNHKCIKGGNTEYFVGDVDLWEALIVFHTSKSSICYFVSWQ